MAHTPNGYQQAILYLNGSQMGPRFCVRNVSRWYVDAVQDCFPGCHPYLQKRNEDGKRDFWCIKSHAAEKPSLASVSDLCGFARAFIELQGYLACYPYLDRRYNRTGTIRKLSIFGAYDDLRFIQPTIPARQREPRLHKTYTGQTYTLLYQSKKEIAAIIGFFGAGFPSNTEIWDRWAEMLR